MLLWLFVFRRPSLASSSAGIRDLGLFTHHSSIISCAWFIARQYVHLRFNSKWSAPTLCNERLCLLSLSLVPRNSTEKSLRRIKWTVQWLTATGWSLKSVHQMRGHKTKLIWPSFIRCSYLPHPCINISYTLGLWHIKTWQYMCIRTQYTHMHVHTHTHTHIHAHAHIFTWPDFTDTSS